MEEPNQGVRIPGLDMKLPRDSTAPSELGIQQDHDDNRRFGVVVPTRTINLSDFQRRVVSVGCSPTNSPIDCTNPGFYLLPRGRQSPNGSSTDSVATDDALTTLVVSSLLDGLYSTPTSDADLATVTVSVSDQSSEGLSLTTTSSSASSWTYSLSSSFTHGWSTTWDTSSSYLSTSTYSGSSTSDASLSSVTSSSEENSSVSPFLSTLSVSSDATWNHTSTSSGSSTNSILSSTASLSTTSTASTTSTTSTAASSTATSTSSSTDANASSQSTSDSLAPTRSTTLTPSTRSEHQTHSTSASSDLSASTSTSIFGPSTSAEASTTVGQGPPGAGYAGSSSTTTSGAAATSSGGSKSSGGGGPGLSPQQQQVVGGVVGGVAGLAVILLVILVILRWYRRRLKRREELSELNALPSLATGPAQPMSQRSSGVPLTSQLASSLRRLRHTSGHTQSTSISSLTVPESERGFQRIAGRKIAPVLTTGGDGFGGNYGAFRQDGDAVSYAGQVEGGVAGASSSHPYGSSLEAGRAGAGAGAGDGAGAGATASGALATATAVEVKPDQVLVPSLSRDFAAPVNNQANRSQVSLHSGRAEGLLSLRPSPARTPVTVSPTASSVRLSIQHSPSVGDDAPPVPQIVVPLGQDDIGRTMFRHDGSGISTRSRSTGHGSRFAENIS